MQWIRYGVGLPGEDETEHLTNRETSSNPAGDPADGLTSRRTDTTEVRPECDDVDQRRQRRTDDRDQHDETDRNRDRWRRRDRRRADNSKDAEKHRADNDVALRERVDAGQAVHQGETESDQPVDDPDGHAADQRLQRGATTHASSVLPKT